MKFESGDLVMIDPESIMYEALEAAANVGVIISSGILMYTHSTSNGEEIQFWAYDVVFDGKTFKNIPEEVLKTLEELKNDEKDIK